MRAVQQHAEASRTEVRTVRACQGGWDAQKMGRRWVARGRREREQRARPFWVPLRLSLHLRARAHLRTRAGCHGLRSKILTTSAGASAFWALTATTARRETAVDLTTVAQLEALRANAILGCVLEMCVIDDRRDEKRGIVGEEEEG